MLILIGILDVVPTGAAKWVQAGITVVWAFVYFFSIGAMAFAVLGETSSASLRAPTIALATATQASTESLDIKNGTEVCANGGSASGSAYTWTIGK